MKNAVFWDVTMCDSCKNRHLGGTYRPHHQGDKNWKVRNNFSSNYHLKNAAKKHIVIANVVPKSPILVTLMMEVIRSSQTSVLTRTTRRNISEDGILHTFSSFWKTGRWTKFKIPTILLNICHSQLLLPLRPHYKFGRLKYVTALDTTVVIRLLLDFGFTLKFYAWSLSFGERHRSRVFQKTVLRAHFELEERQFYRQFVCWRFTFFRPRNDEW
jgi:hypothetical protein